MCPNADLFLPVYRGGLSGALKHMNEQVRLMRRHVIDLETLNLLTPPKLSECEINERINQMVTHKLYYKEKLSLDLADEEMSKIQGEVKIASEYYKVLVEKESWVIQNALLGVNQVLDSVCGEIFSQPIMISIESFKTSVDGKTSRPSVNLKINYDGVNYKSYRKLSSGQINRLTLALAIAFASLSPSKFIMFDEILNRVSEEQRSSAVDCMRKFLTKQVLYIGHKDTENIFDHVLKLN